MNHFWDIEMFFKPDDRQKKKWFKMCFGFLKKILSILGLKINIFNLLIKLSTFLIIFYLFDLRRTDPIFWNMVSPSVCRSALLCRGLLGIGSFVFSKFWHSLRNRTCDSWIFWKKKFLQDELNIRRNFWNYWNIWSLIFPKFTL